MKHFSLYWFIPIVLLSACKAKDGSLDELDSLVAQRAAIQSRYQAGIDSLSRSTVTATMTDRERFEAYGRIYDLYRAFDLDSQRCYAENRLALAIRIARPEYIHAAQMNSAEVYMRSGMYHEALTLLDTVCSQPIEVDLQPYYYHLRRTLYGLLTDFALTEKERKTYQTLTQTYRDSLLTIQNNAPFYHTLVYADALTAEQRYDEALTALETYETRYAVPESDEGIFAITRAQIYQAQGNIEAAREQLIRSACADLRGAVREYVAMRELAVMLYQQGDIDHAYRYIQCAVEDAEAGSMRGRTLEISTIYPIIQSAYQAQVSSRTRLLYAWMLSLAVIVGLLWVLLIYMSRQRTKLALLNSQLAQSNSDLEQSNQIKAMYIGRYMEMASSLIERFDEWRKSLHQLGKANDIKRLQAQIASQHFTQQQIAALYRDFDEAFLTIFPDFVQKVKELVAEDTEFRIKPGERLNTDLRVLGCIRLGITDSAQIASFMRYSLSTIYNSRTRMRNAARCERDQFEQKVATL